MAVLELVARIEGSRTSFLDLVERFDGSTVGTPIGPGRWSPVQYVEHLVRAEEVTVWRMWTAVEDARAGKDVLRSSTPEAIEEIVDRTWGGDVDAPPLAIPRLGGSAAYWSTRMRRNAHLLGRFADVVSDEELDQVAYPHPISGPFTIRQALQFIRFHLDRHRDHLQSVEA